MVTVTHEHLPDACVQLLPGLSREFLCTQTTVYSFLVKKKYFSTAEKLGLYRKAGKGLMAFVTGAAAPETTLRSALLSGVSSEGAQQGPRPS